MLQRLLGLLLLSASIAHADPLTINISQDLGATSLTPIVVQAFTGTQMPVNPGGVIAGDFRRIGQFQVSDGQPAGAGNGTPVVVSVADVNSIPWATLPGNLLVRGSVVSVDKLRVDISYELWQRGGQQPWLSGSFTVDKRRLRDAGHYISDQLYRKIMGQPGIFETHIAYIVTQRTSDGNLRYQLQVSDYDGEQRRTLFESDHPISSPSWSPDGRQLAYISFENGTPAIYLQDATHRARRLIANYPGLNGSPSFSPDGRQMSMTLSRDGNAEVYVMNLADNSLRRITNNDAIDTEAHWNPDGQSLVFTSDRSSKPQLYRVDLNTLDTSRITFDGTFNARADFSPNGRYLAMVHVGSGGAYQINLLDLQTNLSSKLTTHGMHDSPSFAPNSHLLVMDEQQGGRRVLHCLSLDGHADWTISDNTASLSAPAWSPVMR